MCKFKKQIIAGFAGILFLSAILPPDIASALTIREEKEMSVEFLKAVFETYEIIEDPVINEYINRIGQKIIAAMPPQPIDYQFYAVRQDAYNAFAGPGGNIFIFSGLFCALDNEDELAALFSHEIAHVSCRHISEMMKKSQKTHMATMAGVIAGILIGLGGAGPLGTALSYGSLAAGQSMALAYSRENEMQADQIGRTYLQKAGYSLNGMLSILKKIRAVDWFGPEEIPTYLKTHPATDERILYLDNLLENTDKIPTKKTYAFEKAHTQMMALYGNPDTVHRQFMAQIKKDPDNFMAQYGLGLTLSRKGNPKAAVKPLQVAASKNPGDPDFEIDLGKVYFMAGEYQLALKTLEKPRKPTLEAEIRKTYIGRSQMALGYYDQAVETFKTILKEDPKNTDAYFYLGESEGKLNHLADAHYHLGQYYTRKKDMKNTQFHLHKSMEYEKNPDQIEKIKKQLKDMENARPFFDNIRNEKADEKKRTTSPKYFLFHPVLP